MAADASVVLDIVAEEGRLDRSALTPESTLASLGLASLDLISIVFAIEDRLGVILEQEELEGLSTLGQLTALVQSKEPG